MKFAIVYPDVWREAPDAAVALALAASDDIPVIMIDRVPEEEASTPPDVHVMKGRAFLSAFDGSDIRQASFIPALKEAEKTLVLECVSLSHNDMDSLLNRFRWLVERFGFAAKLHVFIVDEFQADKIVELGNIKSQLGPLGGDPVIDTLGLRKRYISGSSRRGLLRLRRLLGKRRN